MLYSFPGPFVFQKEVPEHHEIKDKYLPKILEDIKLNKDKYIIPNWNCEVYSTMYHRVDFLDDQDLVNKIIWNPLDECLSQVKLTMLPKNSRISDLWYNYYDEGFFQESHTHSECSFSGIYLLKLEEKKYNYFFQSFSSSIF